MICVDAYVCIYRFAAWEGIECGELEQIHVDSGVQRLRDCAGYYSSGALNDWCGSNRYIHTYIHVDMSDIIFLFYVRLARALSLSLFTRFLSLSRGVHVMWLGYDDPICICMIIIYSYMERFSP